MSAAPAAGLSPTPLTHGELRVLPYLQTHLTIREIGDGRLLVPQPCEHGSRVDYQGFPPAIGPNETLVFVVDLVEIR